MAKKVTKLEMYRREKGLTRVALADKVGVSVKSIERYEQGLASLGDAKYKTVIALANILGVSPEEIVEE